MLTFVDILYFEDLPVTVKLLIKHERRKTKFRTLILRQLSLRHCAEFLKNSIILD